MSILDVIRCPVCNNTLQRCGKQLVCCMKHSYDISSEGYVNLLPPGHAGNSNTGDDRKMMASRHSFLIKGYYDRISMKLADIISSEFSHSDALRICDMGCGEGYHMSNVSRGLNEKNIKSLSVGFDASKHGASIGSRYLKRIGLMPLEGIGVPFNNQCEAYVIPSNIFKLPANDDIFSAVLSMFAPIPFKEANRILSDGGILIAVSSAKEHLIELRRLIFDNVNSREYYPLDPERFHDFKDDHLEYMIELNNEDLINLFSMTPFLYRTGQDGIERLKKTEYLDVTVSVNYRIFRKAV